MAAEVQGPKHLSDMTLSEGAADVKGESLRSVEGSVTPRIGTDAGVGTLLLVLFGVGLASTEPPRGRESLLI